MRRLPSVLSIIAFGPYVTRDSGELLSRRCVVCSKLSFGLKRKNSFVI